MQKRLVIIIMLGSAIVGSELTYFITRDQYKKSIRTEADRVIKAFFDQAKQNRMDRVFEEIINFNKD